ncbi:uncharacterized protein NECHADRAFT_75911 [Fusarium vanettenii 77-13-4]|uniref:Heterokaryon incompatibility domain-containing protein n=1 Tax=Fusarium vanettenii (strain ATCC MYA-4622 / CBS 123669 / FGSC 9596 / NRRL 45880 / 77-13-4) TaxID=660122 RepID=C7Z5Y3_FUSV7|nr:uncharacterized protein NECHADRAFT_75911 [Fusarium vanettenii 77-13-4]EEU40601.1 hypothetical protein NECHADRAFT_75911 [Fusarium vanettenii 77-13-4]
MSIYTTHPLLPGKTHIRLLRIVPGSSNDEIHCTVNTFDINTAPNYHALSYEWGPKSPLALIHVMGQPTTIRSNLFNFLSRLKVHASHGYLWCDSICIDQANDYERSHQVQLMNQIYRKAQSVLVWLGEARDNSDMTLRTIRILSTCNDNASRAAYSADRATVWQGIVNLSKRRYWTRIWIVQEITVARDVEIFCGSEVVPWSTFAAACKSPPHHVTAWTSDLWAPLAEDKGVGQNGEQTKRHCATSELFHSTMYGLIRSQRRWPTHRESFATLYQRYKDSGCEDGRDRIFALLGIATEVTFERGYNAEYHRTKEETFFSLVAWGGKGAVKLNSRIEFARLTAEAMELTWPHHQLESSLEVESQRSPSFFKWVHQPLAISLRCSRRGKWPFHRQLETTGATIFTADSGAEVHLPRGANEHDAYLDLYEFGFETSNVCLACQVTRQNSWTVVGRVYYAKPVSEVRQRVPSVFQGLTIAADGTGGFGVQLENVAQFMELFLDKCDVRPTRGVGLSSLFTRARGAGTLRRVKESKNRNLEEVLEKLKIASSLNLDTWKGGGGSVNGVDDDSVDADLDKLLDPSEELASSRVPSTSVEKPRKRDWASPNSPSSGMLLVSGRSFTGQGLEAPRRYGGPDRRS